jgi:tRNA (cmo5U34)-methyltransferase
MDESTKAAAAKFDEDRASEYAAQSRIALAGYDACHELAACVLAASLGPGRPARILVVGAGGTGSEVVTAGALEPAWRFVAVDPSEPMLALARSRIEKTATAARTEFHLGTVDDLPNRPSFDAATLIGVLHHLAGDQSKRDVLSAIAARLEPDAPFIVAGNYRAYASEPLLLATWGQRWKMHGASHDDVKAKLGKIVQGADPPASESAVAALLGEAGFEAPTKFFSSLFWGAWVTRRARA